MCIRDRCRPGVADGSVMAVARRSGVQGFAPDAAAVAGKGAPAPARRSFQVVPDASTEVVGLSLIHIY